MPPVQAIGFDLFNTLLTIHPSALTEAQEKLVNVLNEKGFDVEAEAFKKVYIEAAKKFIAETKKDGKETHNRYWIVSALEELGHRVSPEAPAIEEAIEAYFSAFYGYCQLLPGTKEMLGELKGRYRLGLLSNFTHPPAGRTIIDTLGLSSFFNTILISGDLGYRKPHAYTFKQLIKKLAVPAGQIIFVGDDPESDILGAGQAGLRPVLTTMVRDQNIPSAITPMSPSQTICPAQVPQISNWQELFTLLEN